MSIDKPTISTELMTASMVTVTMTGSDGFTGDVTLTAKAVDGAGVDVPNWTVTLDKSTVNFAADGVQTAVATLKVPSQMTTATTPSIKIDVTSSLGTQTKNSAVTVANQLTVPMTLAGATCSQAATAYRTMTVAIGTKVRWVNNDTASRITIHVNGGGTGFNHEPDPGMAPNGGAYEQTGTQAGTLTWYCHAPGNDANRYNITVQ